MPEHNPPRVRGVFACPAGYFTSYLLSATQLPSKWTQRGFYLKDRGGQRMVWDEHVIWDDDKGRIECVSTELYDVLRYRNIQQQRLYMCDEGPHILVRNKQRRFTHRGTLWHHLVDEVEKQVVLAREPHWVLTTHDAWLQAFRKRIHKDRRALHALPEIDYGPEWMHRPAKWKECRHSPQRNPYARNQGDWLLSYLEVFISKES